jgi:leucyl aminopeptidase (aminopeptidase T)
LSMYMELAKAAHTLVNDVLLIKKGEDVLIWGDTACDEAVCKATASAAYTAGATPCIVLFQTKANPMEEPPKPLAAAMMNADVTIEYAMQYLLYTKAQVDALNQRNRAYICLTGCDTEGMVRTIAMVNYKKMIQLGDKLAELTGKADEIRITSPAGTDFTGKIGGRPVENYGSTADKRKYIMLGGQTGWACLENSQDGTLVFDGNLWPPDEVRANIRTPIKLKVAKGVIKEISGGIEADIFKKWMTSFNDENMYRIAHICYGYNPGARITGNIAEVERVFGVVQVGWGTQGPLIRPDLGGKPGWRAAAHCDGIMLNPSVYLDGETIEEKGRYVHPDLARIVKEM